jgi:hypothetical protein
MIMKAKYLKPTAEDLLLTIDDLMITVSGNADKIVEDGGSTSEGGIIEGDARRYNVWDDEDVLEEE